MSAEKGVINEITLTKLKYPVLRFSRGMMFAEKNADDITNCSKVALKKGFFSGQILVDSTGKVMLVKQAKKLHGVGPFWGYSFFLNQRIKVNLELEEQTRMSIEEVRGRVLGVLRQGQEWKASNDYEDLVALVECAGSISEIAKVITDAYF